MDSSQNAKKFIKIDPGSTFNTYYSCTITGWMLSTSFKNDKGTTFSKEVTIPLQPFIQFPFRRFLVGQWKNYMKTYSKSYYIIISEVADSRKETCLKMFRLLSNSEVIT